MSRRRKPAPEPVDPESRSLPDAIVVNCGGCRVLLAVDRDLARAHAMPHVSGRINGRAYCRGCLDVSGAGVSGLAGGMATDFGSPSPWNETAQRAREERG